MNTELLARLVELQTTLGKLIDDVRAALPRALDGYLLGGNAAGTSLQAEFDAPYTALQALLGEPPSISDGFKVSTEWVLTDAKSSAVVTIYDYKETNLYDPDLPTVEQFRQRSSYRWHIGASNKTAALALVAALEQAIGNRP